MFCSELYRSDLLCHLGDIHAQKSSPLFLSEHVRLGKRITFCLTEKQKTGKEVCRIFPVF